MEDVAKERVDPERFAVESLALVTDPVDRLGIVLIVRLRVERLEDHHRNRLHRDSDAPRRTTGSKGVAGFEVADIHILENRDAPAGVGGNSHLSLFGGSARGPQSRKGEDQRQPSLHGSPPVVVSAAPWHWAARGCG